MSRPTLQQLVYLVALADEGHFGRAADACDVSQPGLSAQIKELEQRLGTTLVERLPKGLRLTPAGVDVVARARRLLCDVDEMAEATQVAADAIRGPLVVGAIPTVAPYLLGDFVPAVTDGHPDAALRFQELPTRELLAALRSGELDLALCALPVTGTDLVSRPVLVDPFLLAISEHHRLAGDVAPLPLSALSRLNILLLEEGHCLRDQALEVCSTARSKTTDLRATSLPTLVQMVSADVGATLLPLTAASVEARAGNGITVRRFKRPPSRTIALVWRSSSPRDRFYRVLAEGFSARLSRFRATERKADERP